MKTFMPQRHPPRIHSSTNDEPPFHASLLFSAPTAVLVQVKGLVGCLDTVLFDWLSYAPQVSQLANQKAASGSMAVPGIVDQALADSTSPLKNKQTSQGKAIWNWDLDKMVNQMLKFFHHIKKWCSFEWHLKKDFVCCF